MLRVGTVERTVRPFKYKMEPKNIKFRLKLVVQLKLNQPQVTTEILETYSDHT